MRNRRSPVAHAAALVGVAGSGRVDGVDLVDLSGRNGVNAKT